MYWKIALTGTGLKKHVEKVVKGCMYAYKIVTDWSLMCVNVETQKI